MFASKTDVCVCVCVCMCVWVWVCVGARARARVCVHVYIIYYHGMSEPIADLRRTHESSPGYPQVPLLFGFKKVFSGMA
jgi:hypothetical protein